MSREDIQAIVDIALKPKERTQNRLIITIIILIMIPTLLIGIDIGNWREWRNNISKEVVRIGNKVDGNDITADNRRAQEISKIQVK